MPRRPLLADDDRSFASHNLDLAQSHGKIDGGDRSENHIPLSP